MPTSMESGVMSWSEMRKNIAGSLQNLAMIEEDDSLDGAKHKYLIRAQEEYARILKVGRDGTQRNDINIGIATLKHALGDLYWENDAIEQSRAEFDEALKMAQSLVVEEAVAFQAIALIDKCFDALVEIGFHVKDGGMARWYLEKKLELDRDYRAGQPDTPQRKLGRAWALCRLAMFEEDMGPNLTEAVELASPFLDDPETTDLATMILKQCHAFQENSEQVTGTV